MPFNKTTSNVGVDLGPAEAELRKAYMALLPEIQRLGDEGYRRRYGASSLYGSNPFQNLPDMPVLHIVAKGRRVEYGWYHEDKWETQSSKIATALGVNPVVKSHDEVFIAGEALGWDTEKLVELLIHQILHQFGHEPSTTSNHSREFGTLAQYIGVREVRKHPTRGFIDWHDMEGRLTTVIMNVAKSINKTAFNIYRKDEGNLLGTGRMKQWTCGCRKPKVYTGGVLFMTCDKCQQPLRYSHKDRMIEDVYQFLNYKKGLAPDRIASWRCVECGNMHDWVGGITVNYRLSFPNYPDACLAKTGVKP